MLLVALGWAWALVITLGLGLGLQRGLRAALGPLPPSLTSSPELLILSGLAALAWLVAILNYALPVGPVVQIGLSLLGSGLLLACRAELRRVLRTYRRSWRRAGSGALGLAGVLSALVLVHAAQPPAFPDAALYHAQVVQWAHRFPVVPGLGNLHGRLAFNSHLHLLTAFFSPAGSPGRVPAFQQIANSLGFVLVLWQLVRLAACHLRPGGQPGRGYAYLGSVLLLLMVVRPWISSPLPDTAVATWGLLLLSVLLETPRPTAAGLGWLGLLSATLVTLKASAAAVLLWPLLWVLSQPRQYRFRLLKLLAASSLLVLLPWLGRNVVLSGYAVYPLAGQAGKLVPTWAVPAPQQAADLAEIRWFARRPVADWRLAAGQPVRQWVPFWWQQQEPADHRLLLLVALSGLLVASRLLWRPPDRWWRQPGYQLYGLLWLGIGWWSVAAPALRFAYLYLIGAATLGPLLVVPVGLARPLRAGGWLLLGLGVLYGLNGLGHEVIKPGALTTYAVWPANYAATPTLAAGHLGPYALRVAALDGRCGNCPLPCADTLRLGLRLRGATLQQGFRTAGGVSSSR